MFRNVNPGKSGSRITPFSRAMYKLNIDTFCANSLLVSAVLPFYALDIGLPGEVDAPPRLNDGVFPDARHHFSAPFKSASTGNHALYGSTAIRKSIKRCGGALPHKNPEPAWSDRVRGHDRCALLLCA